MLTSNCATVLIMVLVVTHCVNCLSHEELQEWQNLLDEHSEEPSDDDDESNEMHLSKVRTNKFGDFSIFGKLGTSGCTLPPNFPYGLHASLTEFENWTQDVRVNNVWTMYPRNAADIVKLANWAYVYGYKIRPKGFSKSWAPLTATANTKCSNTILVDTKLHMTDMKMINSKTNSDLRAVHVQSGTSMEDLLQFLSSNNAALYAAPVMGESTIGGVLATGGHGIGAPRSGNRIPLGFSAGSLSNLILSLRAIVWNPDSQSYVIKKFSRGDEDAKVFMTHIGRAFITDIRLLVGQPFNLRCESRFDFVPQHLLRSGTNRLDSDKETVLSLVERFSSVDLTYYPYTEGIWAMICSNTTRNQGGSRFVGEPYPFSSSTYQFPKPVLTVSSKLLTTFSYVSPLISKVEYKMDMMSVKSAKNDDIWGSSENMMLRYKTSKKRTISCGYAILTARSNVQKVASEFYSVYSGLVTKFADAWQFPQNVPLQISITGLDNSRDIPGLKEFDAPALSFLSPVKGKDFDTAVVVSVSAYPGTKYFNTFMRELEAFLFLKYDGEDAIVRPEWSKAWGFTDVAAWDNHLLLQKIIPASFGEDWEFALKKLDYYDPYMIFSNDFLDSFLRLRNGTLNFINSP